MTDSGPAFAGGIPAAYETYLVPLVMRDYAADLAARVSPRGGGSVLEIAAGTGVLTRLLRERLPASVKLVATDLSPDMLQFATSHVGPHDGLDFRTADGTALPFPDASFDAVACQFGVMFYPDKAKGFAEALRVLRPGGVFAFNVWDSLARNPMPDAVRNTVEGLFPADPPRFIHLPHGYNDIAAIKDGLQAAGFAEIEIVVKPRVARAATARAAAMALVAGNPYAVEIADRREPPLELVVDEVARVLGERFGSAPFEAPIQAILFVARKA